MIVLGFLGFKVISRVIYGFWGWIYECEGVARSFMGFLGISRGFFRGLECGLCLKMLFNDVLFFNIMNIVNVVIYDIIWFYTIIVAF